MLFQHKFLSCSLPGPIFPSPCGNTEVQLFPAPSRLPSTGWYVSHVYSHPLMEKGVIPASVYSGRFFSSRFFRKSVAAQEYRRSCPQKAFGGYQRFFRTCVQIKRGPERTPPNFTLPSFYLGCTISLMAVRSSSSMVMLANAGMQTRSTPAGARYPLAIATALIAWFAAPAPTA